MRHRLITSSALTLLLAIAASAAPPAPPVPGQPAPAASLPAKKSPFLPKAAPAEEKDEKLYSFKFENADLDVVIQTYCDWTDQIYLKNDDIKASITLKADNLTKSESIQVISSILAMNNIALIPMGEKFVKVVQSTAGDLTGHGLKINADQDAVYTGGDRFVTQIIQLNHVEIPEVQAAIQHVLHAYGKILALQSSNSIMITDTEDNIIRAQELIKFIDQPSAKIEPRIYQIKYADAVEIASKLDEIILIAQEDQAKTGGNSAGTAASTVKAPPGVMRARARIEKATTPTKATIAQTEGGSNLIIQGKVQVMSDERTNILIVFSQVENFPFFDKIIEVLDIEVNPITTFEVVNLEYADAEELSSTLNELVGAAQSKKSSSSSSSTKSPTARTSSSNSRNTPTVRANLPESDVQNLSNLSENTKIIADKRSNSILLTGRKSDIAALKTVIGELDVMLEQVVIEAVIFEIGLDDNLQHGIDWLYQSTDGNKIGAWDGSSLTSITNVAEEVVSGALSYFLNVPGINTKFLVNLSKTDTNARLVSNPVIITTDNTEATLSIGEQRPVVTSTDSFANSSGTQRSNYEYKDIGIQLTVTPRINPERYVVMEIKQTADQIGPIVEIDGNQVPVIFNREFEASVAVPDKGTVVLGGLISTDKSDSVNKIPLLGDIPLIGRYLFSSVTKVETQRELLVILTPSVMTNKEEMQRETERLYQGTRLTQDDWNQEEWSASKLKQLMTAEDLEKERKAKEKEEKSKKKSKRKSSKSDDEPSYSNVSN